MPIYKSRVLRNRTRKAEVPVPFVAGLFHITHDYLTGATFVCGVVSVLRIISRRRGRGASFVLNLFKRTPLSPMIQLAANYKTRRARSPDCKSLKTDPLVHATENYSYLKVTRGSRTVPGDCTVSVV